MSCPYPVEILPNPSYKLISCSVSEQYLVRHTKAKSVEEVVDENQHVREEYICSPADNVLDLSTSLLGVFNYDHLKIELINSATNPFNEYCAPNCECLVPQLDKDFVVGEAKHFWVLKIGAIDGERVEYPSPNDLLATCKVRHTPMKWNFWHFSLNWYLPQDECYAHELSLAIKKTNRIKKRLSHECRALVKMRARVEKPNAIALDTSCYMD